MTMPKDLLKEHQQEEAQLEVRHKSFIEQAVSNSAVWLLDDGEGVATSSSTVFFDENDQELGVIPVWADKADAKAAAKEEWSQYNPVSIPLATFLEFHLIKMSNDDLMAGVNWNATLAGKELHPVELALELVAELEAQNKTIDLEHHDSLEEYKEITESVAEEIFGE
jgi:Protein of unknown function (DUF2750)